jgi:hypothetical protein
MSASRFLFLMGLAVAGATACGGSGGTSGGGEGGSGATSSTDGGGGAGGAGGAGLAPKCTGPTEVACSDAVILDMGFKAAPAPGLITSQADGAGWISNIDAVAGGAFNITDSYTYGKFTPEGLVKVDISDEASLTSMDWDIAFRRYVIRINSADSGPSCVEAARVPMATFADLTSVPDTLTYHPDDYFTDSCDFIPDGSGLESSPATALAAYYEYPGCVKMSDFVFVIVLADGHHVKFAVDSYYYPEIQETCDTTGMVPMADTGSANFVVRWAFLD